MEPFTVRLPLPPTTNHAYKLILRGGRPRLAKTTELMAWELGARLLVGAHVVPAHRPLAVRIALEVPSALVRRADLDGFVKALVDVVVTKRADQWVDRLVVTKRPGDGWATVTVEQIGAEVAP